MQAANKGVNLCEATLKHKGVKEDNEC